MLPLWLAVAVVVMAVVVFVVATDTRNRMTTAPGPSNAPTWRGPFNVAAIDATPFAAVGVLSAANVILLRTGFDESLAAFDLSVGQTLFTLIPDGDVVGSDDAIVAIEGVQIKAFDPKTGQIINQSATSGLVRLLWEGEGMVLVENLSHMSLCLTLLSDLGTCAWQAPDMYFVGKGNVFGGGRWVNTGAGVVDIKTGQLASFGKDAKCDSSNCVYYAGDTDTRIFRVKDDGSENVTYQPWDVKLNVGVSNPVPANQVFADAASPVYLAVVTHRNGPYADNPTTTSAFSWETGERLWSRDSGVYYPALHLGQFMGGSFVIPVPDENSFETIVAVNPSTGDLAWQPGLYYLNYVGASGDIVYTVGSLQPKGKLRAQGADDQIIATDAANGFTVVWHSQMPEQSGSCSPGLAGNYIYCVDTTSGKIWVMDL